MGEHGTDMMEIDVEKRQRSFGIIPRAVLDVFAAAKALQTRKNTNVNVNASYMEIYNERLYDLLQV